MCYKVIEKYSCGDQEDAFIPCEGFIETGACTQPEQAKQDQVTEHDKKCRECLHFDNEMKKLVADPELSKPERAPAKPHDGPKLYFIECTKWFCGHISDPKETNIERDATDREYLEIVGSGSCLHCARMTSAEIAEMKRNGTYDQPDPFGAMKSPVVAAGSSSAGPTSLQAAPVAPSTPKAPEPAPMGLDEIEEIEDDEDTVSPEDKARQAGVAAGAPTSLGQSRSPSPTLGKKGKGRVGKPENEYADRYGAASEEEDEPEHSEDEDEDEAPRGRRGPNMDANIRTKHRSLSSKSSEEDHEAPFASKEFIEISPEERATYKIPATAQLTATQFARWKARSPQAAQLGMQQHSSGEIEDDD